MENSEQVENIESSVTFNPETLNILLSVIPDPDHVFLLNDAAEEKGLNYKNEFHCTIIGRETGEKILEILDSLTQEDREALILDIENLYKKYSWKYIPTQDYYLISKEYSEGDRRESLLQVVQLSDLANFYRELNFLLGTNFDIPFPHITLFTTSTKEDKKLRGIGIYSEEQFYTLNPQKLDTSI